MTIGDLYVKVQNTRKNMTTPEEAKKLAQHLNAIFYPPSEQSNAQEMRSASNTLVNEILQLLGDYEFKNSIRGIHSSISSKNADASTLMASEDNFKELEGMLSTTVEKEQNTCYRKFSTIQARLRQLEKIMTQIPVPTNGKTLAITERKQEEVKNSLKVIYDEITSYLRSQGYDDTAQEIKNNFIGTSKSNAATETGATIAHRIYQLQEITDFLVLNPIAVPAKVYGDVLEYSLGAISGVELSKVPQKIMRMMKKGMNLKEIKEVHGAETNLHENNSHAVIKAGNVIVEYSEEGSKKDPFSNRQGKMDVWFKLPGTKKKYRVSAKNWGTVRETEKMPRDFGSTSVGSAVMRTLGPEGLYDNFSPSIVYPRSANERNALANSHQIAKYSLLLDILMGYSQKKNYADTVVINDRQAKEIKVFSIWQIIEAVGSETVKLSIRDYDDGIGGKNWYNFRQGLSYNDVYNELLKYRASLRYLDLVNTMGGEDKFVYGKKSLTNA